MHSSLLHTATTHRHLLSWKLPEKESIIPSGRRKLFFKSVIAYSSLGTSLDCCESDGNSPIRLPFVIRSSAKVSRFLWDGDCLQLVSVDGGASSFELDDGNGFLKLFRICSFAVRDFLIPQQVAENYMDYVKWKFLHRVFSSALQVLATQAMFRAIGVGYSYSLPSAAALNWVLKDGIGRLSRCIYTASLACAFDTNLKLILYDPINVPSTVMWSYMMRVRFSTSVLFVASIGLELLTPSFPQCFLLLATIANIAKQISLACYLATRSAVHQSFAVADNLGEISAKAQIQTVCFDNLGLMLAALLNLLFGNYQRWQAGLHLLIYPIFAGMDLLGIYQGLKHVHLKTLTKDRLEIILNTWIELGYVPSPAEVSEKEGIDILGIKGQELWPIRIGCLNPSNQIPIWSIKAMQCITGKDFNFICIEILSKRLKKTRQHGILLSLREGAEPVHIISGLLQACYIQRALLGDCSRWEDRIMESKASNSSLKEWSVIIEDSKKSAERDLSNLLEQIPGKGWIVKSILLSTKEQARYTFVCD